MGGYGMRQRHRRMREAGRMPDGVWFPSKYGNRRVLTQRRHEIVIRQLLKANWRRFRKLRGQVGYFDEV